MFRQNMGMTDRAIRIVAGLALIAAFFFYPEASWRWAFLIGIVPLVTGLFGSCPAYSIFGINTCATRRS